MKVRRLRRPGRTKTFSVSVDPETRRALRALADAEFGGNLSALVTDFAAEAKRRMAAGAYVKGLGFGRLTTGEADELESNIRSAVAAAERRRRRRRAA
jgi:hypothetical protein